MDNLEKKAWLEWFKSCAIKRCTLETQKLLSDCILKTLKARRKVLLENGMMDLEAKAFEARALTFFDAYYSIGLSYCKETGAEIKPRKQWLLDNIARSNYTLEQTVYGKLLGKELFTIVREIQKDISQDVRATTPISTSDNRSEGHVLQMNALPVHSCDDDSWIIETFADKFIKMSANPLLDVELLRSLLFPRGAEVTNKRLQELPTSTLYHKRNKAIQLVKMVLDSNEELSDILKVKGGRLFPIIFTFIEKKVVMCQ